MFSDKIKFVNEQYDDIIWVNDEWYSNIDEYLEQSISSIEYIDEVHAYTSENYKIQLNVNCILDDIEESCIDDLPEDRSLDEISTNYDIFKQTIIKAVEDFNSAQKENCFRPNYNEGVLYTEEYLKKLFEENNK